MTSPTTKRRTTTTISTIGATDDEVVKKTAPFSVFATRLPQNNSRLFALPLELRNQIYAEVFARDVNHPTPELAILSTCKRLYQEASITLMQDLTFVHVQIVGYPQLAEKLLLLMDLEGIVLENPSEVGRVSSFEGYSMRLRITVTKSRHIIQDQPGETENLLLFDLTSLRFFARHMVTLRLQNDKPDVRKWKYEFVLPHLQAESTTRQKRRESQLLHPFLEFWWSGFSDLSITGALDEDLAMRLVRSVQLDKWSSPFAYILYLEGAYEAGVDALDAADLYKAHKTLHDARYIQRMTINSRQNFWSRRHGTTWCQRFCKVSFLLDSCRSMVFLRMAEVAAKHKDRACHYHGAFNFCTSGIIAANIGGYTPTNKELSEIYFIRAKSSRLRNCMKLAQADIKVAISLCPDNAELEEEARLIAMA